MGPQSLGLVILLTDTLVDFASFLVTLQPSSQTTCNNKIFCLKSEGFQRLACVDATFSILEKYLFTFSPRSFGRDQKHIFVSLLLTTHHKIN